MDALFNFFKDLLPLIYAVVGLGLIYFLVLLIRFFIRLLKTADEVNLILKDVNHKLARLDPTVETVHTISSTVDHSFKAGGRAVASTVGRLRGTVTSLRQAVDGLKRKNH